ncbi:hypothetical protein OI18_17585 [Flavihumibacter solisilvae]|uniref:Thioredoxin domain-containing protein n=1 Tax=Flavihumibacter solisilvae TaxID=1349421 RepID=A0A0C1L1U0_9BACT|nr:hypothetical protein OI18_17585 [Flavihumibacter solisilvae]
MKRSLVAILLCITQIVQANQPGTFVEGQPSPQFSLQDVQNFSSTSFSPADAKGKWLLLNFFAIGCASSFTSLAKIDSLQRYYVAEVQTFMVGKWDKEATGRDRELRDQYAEYQERYSLAMPFAYMPDSALKKLGVWTMPYTVLVDQAGIVRAIFHIGIPSLEQVLALIRGQIVNLPGSYADIQQKKVTHPFTFGRPLFEKGNGGPQTTYLYRSLLTPEQPFNAPNPLCINSGYGNQVQFINKSLDQLLMYAYADTMSLLPNYWQNIYGKYYPIPIWEGFKQLPDVTKKYCYSLVVPPDRAHPFELQGIMQDDLRAGFNAVAIVETRRMPCWKLTVRKGKHADLRSKGGLPKDGEYDMAAIHLRNVPVSKLIKHLWDRYRTDDPIVDATGIDFNIDLDMDVLFTEPLDFARKALHKQGLELEQGTCFMKVVVVRPSKKRY